MTLAPLASSCTISVSPIASETGHGCHVVHAELAGSYGDMGVEHGDEAGGAAQSDEGMDRKDGSQGTVGDLEPEEAEPAKPMRRPCTPTIAEWVERMATHMPFRDWCPY